MNTTRSHARVRSWREGRVRAAPRQFLAGDCASQLLELALVLPVLAVFVVAIADFGAGYVLKDKLTSAAREGARISVSAPNDTDNPQCPRRTPCSVEVAATAVVNFLAAAGVGTCGLNPSRTRPSAGPGAFAWTYTSSTTPSCPTPWSLTIERAVAVNVSGAVVLCTRVTVRYPFRWDFGRIVKLLAPSSSYANSLMLLTQEVMPNLS